MHERDTEHRDIAHLWDVEVEGVHCDHLRHGPLSEPCLSSEKGAGLSHRFSAGVEEMREGQNCLPAFPLPPYVLVYVPRFGTVCCPVLVSPRRKHEASAHHVKRGPLHGTRRVGVQGGRACCHRQRTRLFPLSRTAFACREHVFGPVERQGRATRAARDAAWRRSCSACLMTCARIVAVSVGRRERPNEGV